jgi:hypothetical protein
MTDFIWYHPNTNVHYTFLSNGKNNWINKYFNSNFGSI